LTNWGTVPSETGTKWCYILFDCIRTTY